MVRFTHDTTHYEHHGDCWWRVRTTRTACGVSGFSAKPVTLNAVALWRGGAISVGHVDWFYRLLLWAYRQTGIKRFIIWYKNLEDE